MTAPSNIAVDKLVEKLSVCDVGQVRIGHPARMSPHILQFCLEWIIAESGEFEGLEDIVRNVQTVFVSAEVNLKGEKKCS